MSDEEDFEQAQARIDAQRASEAAEAEAEKKRRKEEKERKRREEEEARRQAEQDNLKTKGKQVIEEASFAPVVKPQATFQQELTETVVAAMKAENVVLESRIKSLEEMVKELQVERPTDVFRMLPPEYRPGTASFENALLKMLASIAPEDLPNNSMVTRSQKQGNRTSHMKDAIRVIKFYYEKGGYV